MTSKDVILETAKLASMLTGEYLGDLTDEEMLMRAVPGINHPAWQLGHLIGSEHMMISAMGHSMPDLPADFLDRHGRETCGSDDPAKFLRRAEYFDLMERVRVATLAALGNTPDDQLDAPAPERVRAYSPTVGTTFLMVATHELMHVGQFVALRRKLGKPVKI